MIYVDSRDFFEISMGPPPENGLKARLLCLGDFLKRSARLPLALIGKAFRTLLRGISVIFSALLITITLSSSQKSRELFVERIVHFAKDLADWALLPFALSLCFLRLILALLIHPSFYFNAL